MYCRIEDHENQCIQYLDVNSWYLYIMSVVDFPLGHLEIKRNDHSCRNLLDKLKRENKEFIGLCHVRVLAPNNLFVPCLAHKMEGKLMFCLCRACSTRGYVQRSSCTHNEVE